jgi:hypothetical protein
MKDAVKFKYGSSEVTFYEDEVSGVRVRKIQPRIVHRLRNGRPIIYFTDVQHKIIEIDFWLHYSDVRDRIETLRSHAGTLICYYRYGFDGNYDHSVVVQMIKNDVSDPFYAGCKKADEMIQVTLYESSTGEAMPAPTLISKASIMSSGTATVAPWLISKTSGD